MSAFGGKADIGALQIGAAIAMLWTPDCDLVLEALGSSAF